MGLPQLIRIIFSAFYVILLLRVIFSWVPVSGRSPALLQLRRFSNDITEPLLQPIRRLLAPYQRSAPVDFSPLLLFAILRVLENIITRLLWL